MKIVPEGALIFFFFFFSLLRVTGKRFFITLMREWELGLAHETQREKEIWLLF